jgi:acetaldehyde dehydrogenase/alcohol dehydrogenase
LQVIIPTTNPTSTAIFKSLICLKTRNAIIFSPHPRAKASTIAAAKLVLDAAVKAGAPKDIIGWIDVPSMELSNMLLHHPLVDCILATGGPGMVKAAYSSGKPALGVGPGNVPAIVEETADIKMAVSYILMSKTFDNGMICASEQSIIAVDEVYDAIKKELEYRGAYILKDKEEKQVSKIILTENCTVNPNIVGQSAFKIADLAGVKVPKDTKVLVGEEKTTDASNSFAHEKLSPIIALYHAKDYKKAVDIAHVYFIGGAGHTAVLYMIQGCKIELTILQKNSRQADC